jgi:hypothetical protein
MPAPVDDKICPLEPDDILLSYILPVIDKSFVIIFPEIGKICICGNEEIPKYEL